MSRVFKDGWTAVLSNPISAEDSTIQLQSINALALPYDGDFAILTLRKITDGAVEYFELVKVTAIDSNTLTVERAQDGTSAHEFDNDAEVFLASTASAFTQPVEHSCTITNGNVLIRNGTRQTLIASADTACSFKDLQDGQSITLKIKSGNYKITFPTIQKWFGNTLNIVANKDNIVVVAKDQGELEGYFIGSEL